MEIDIHQWFDRCTLYGYGCFVFLYISDSDRNIHLNRKTEPIWGQLQTQMDHVSLVGISGTTKMEGSELTHCGLVTSYGLMYLGHNILIQIMACRLPHIWRLSTGTGSSGWEGIRLVVSAIATRWHPYRSINSLWSSDTIWRQRSGSTLAQVMACCLTAPSHYLNQCWLIISEVQWYWY